MLEETPHQASKQVLNNNRNSYTDSTPCFTSDSKLRVAVGGIFAKIQLETVFRALWAGYRLCVCRSVRLFDGMPGRSQDIIFFR